jgi:lipopolysaccharide/colanic/teichoic acid biosynthesis glycosyltransferase
VALTRQTIVRNPGDSLFEPLTGQDRSLLDEAMFRRMLAVERKRTERTKAPFLLMLIEADGSEGPDKSARTLAAVTMALLASSRDTDLIGWYSDRAVLGAIYTGLTSDDKRAVLNTFLSKVNNTLRAELTDDQFNLVKISFHIFPDDWDHGKPGQPSNATLYPDITSQDKGRRSMLVIKRFIDVVGSVALLTLCSPLFLIIALAVKATSKGPVFFRQQRVGRYGKTFTFLKFRSMYVNNDSTVHQQFVKNLIADAGAGDSSNKSENKVYKIVNDKRITGVGRFLRRTSLDELPQFLNVLKGEMSLVGPRPPIPYELAAYQIWHRRRLLAVKPGITGLWQVMNRSTVKFDEMVRLDLRYASTWSPWLDLKILLRTPFAVIKGTGAY